MIGDHKEIERRWLVHKIKGGIETLESLASGKTRIEQGYFEVPNHNDSFRVRIKDGTEAELTVKSGSGLVRNETPLEYRRISFGLGKEMMRIAYHKILKTRYYINDWEIDVFHELLNGIILAEKEMWYINENVSLPSFIEQAKEVTDCLTNLHLARLATDITGLGIPAMPFVSETLMRLVPCIGLVGGPGSGKTGIINVLKNEFSDIYFVPEAAEIIISQLGISPSEKSPFLNRKFQKALYDITRIFRYTSTEFAFTCGKHAIVFDRPEADGAAYCDNIREFEKIHCTTIDIELKKIKTAIYLEMPPKEIYENNKKNHPERHETYEEALARDAKTRAVWNLHPDLHFIDNEGGWEAKVNRVRTLIKSLLI